MGNEKKSCTGSDDQVTKRLFTILILMIGLTCIFGGYMLGRMARSEVKQNKELLTLNLTVAADNLYKKAKKLPPKAVHNHDTETIRNKLLDIFDCARCDCSPVLDKYNLAEFIKNTLNVHISKLMKSVYNASNYLDTLR